jgi:hypothetical protein
MPSAANLTIIIGLILLAIEIWVLGLSTIVLLALGLGCIITGLLAHLTIFPIDPIWLTSLSALNALILLLILWKPLKKWQQPKTQKTNQYSDFIGLTFILESELTFQQPSQIRYSGILWKLILSSKEKEETYPIGTKVTVIGVDVGQFTVIADQN